MSKEEELARLLYIKQICYGMGIPPRDSECYKEIEKLREEITSK